MKLNTPEFKALFSPELTALSNMFEVYGYEIRIAGGAVRDLLMGKEPKDLDFATVATPDQMKIMFNKECIRMLNMKGEKHGTITVRINEEQNYEVTTLRVDVVTDGRHAEVKFTTDWELDANRRDLTINSLFLGLDGTIYDYFNGVRDLENRKVIFVGDPVKRIQEDYLRILRYFRFFGRISPDPNSHMPPTIQAIEDNMHGLQRISGERIWTELKQILAGNFAGELMMKMVELGIGPYIGLPIVPNTKEFEIVWKRSLSNKISLQPITLLAALLRTENEMMDLHSRLKLSAFERDLGLFVIMNREDKVAKQRLKPYQSLLVTSKTKPYDTREWIIQVLYYRGEIHLADEFKKWEAPKFPVGGAELKEAGVPHGRAMSQVLQQLKEEWIESDFKMTTEELVVKIPHILEKVSTNKMAVNK